MPYAFVLAEASVIGLCAVFLLNGILLLFSPIYVRSDVESDRFITRFPIFGKVLVSVCAALSFYSSFHVLYWAFAVHITMFERWEWKWPTFAEICVICFISGWWVFIVWCFVWRVLPFERRPMFGYKQQDKWKPPYWRAGCLYEDVFARFFVWDFELNLVVILVFDGDPPQNILNVASTHSAARFLVGTQMEFEVPRQRDCAILYKNAILFETRVLPKNGYAAFYRAFVRSKDLHEALTGIGFKSTTD